jgi:hypothetical protein
MSFVIGGAAISKLVLATDCDDTKLKDLTETYQEKSDADIPVGLRWFYCAGFGIALACMSKHTPFHKQTAQLTSLGVISVCHIHKDTTNVQIRLRKRYRTANRLGVSVIMLCLPTAHSLNSLHLISIMTGLILWVLVLELWGVSCPGESFFGEKTACRYTATCKISKKELQSAAKTGHMINVQDLSERGEKGMYELS